MNIRYKNVISACLTVVCLVAWTGAPAYSAYDSVTKPLDEGIKYSVGKISDWARDKALSELRDRWLRGKTEWIIDVTDTGLFKKFFDNTGTVVNALQIGECIYAGDYKAAAEIGSLTLIGLAIPVVGQVLALGKIYVEFMRGLDSEIYNINKKTVYKYFQKDEKLWDPATGVDRFIDVYLMNDSTLRAFVFEYAQRDLGRAPTKGWEWFSGKQWWEDRKKTRCIVASLRFEFKHLYEKEMELKRFKENVKAALGEFERFIAFLKSNKGWVEERAKEIQEGKEKSSYINKKLNEQVREIIREVTSSIPDTPSPRMNFSHLSGEAYEKEYQRVQTILNANQQTQQAFYEHGTKLPEVLKEAITENDPKTKRISRPSSYNLHYRFGTRSLYDFNSDKIRLIQRLKYLAEKYYVPDDFVRYSSYNTFPADEIEDRIESYKERYKEQIEELQEVFRSVQSALHTKISEEKRTVNSQQSLINQIKYTGYEDYDRSIRIQRQNMDKVVIQKSISLERDKKIWENISEDYDPVEKEINEVIESLETASGKITKVKSAFNALVETNKRSADFLKKWKSEKIVSLDGFRSNLAEFQRQLDKVQQNWERVFKSLESYNYYPESKKEAVINDVIKNTAGNGSALTTKINQLYYDYYGSENNKKLNRRLVQYIYVKGKRQVKPQKYFNFDRIHYPHVEDYMNWADLQDGERRRALFEESMKGIKEAMEETRSCMENLKAEVRHIYAEMAHLIDMLRYFDDIEWMKNTIHRIQQKQLSMYADIAAYEQGLQNYMKAYKEMLNRTGKEKQDELNRSQQAQRILEEERKAQEEISRFRAVLSDIDELRWELVRMKRYFDSAIAQRQIGFAQTLYLNMAERVEKISLIHDNAKIQYLAITSSKYQREAEQAMARVIDMKTTADLILGIARVALDPLIRDIDSLKEDLMTLLGDQDIEDVISGRTDSDGDGISDRDELQLGSDPTDSESTPFEEEEDDDDDEMQIIYSGIATLSDQQSFDFSTGQVINGLDDDVTFYNGGGTPFFECFDAAGLGIGMKDMPGDFTVAPAETGKGVVYNLGYNPVSAGDYIAVYTGSVENKYAKFYIQNYSSPNITIQWWYISDGSRSFNQ